MSHYVNLNIERSLSGHAITGLSALPTVNKIAELDLVNRGTADVIVYDHKNQDVGFPVKQNESFTFAGMTSSQQVSVRTDAGSSQYFVRTRRYSKYSRNR